MPPRPCAVMFDLDGTLVQTRAASWDVFRKISDEFGLGLTDPQEYFALFRGNIFSSIQTLCRDRADSERVKKAFLDRLREEYNPAMVPGMVDVIRRLAGHCTLAVVSSNATEVLRRVLVGNGIAYCFAHVFGGDVAPDKTAAIRSFLSDTSSQYGRRCEVAYDETPAEARPGLGTTVLVTDTAGDVRDALEVGIRAVGVAWGMHTADELSDAGAEFVAIWPQELPGYLLGDDAAAPLTGACAASGPTARPGPVPEARGAVDCRCGCSARPAPRAAQPPASTVAGPLPGPPADSLADRLAAAAAARHDRRRRAAQAQAGHAAPTRVSAQPAWTRDPAQPPTTAELRDAVRRIIAPAPGR